jgi:porin
MRKLLLACISCCCVSMVGAEEIDAPQAYTWNTALTLEAVSNLQGGVAKGTKTLANFDATLAVDTEAAGWWSHGTWFVYALGDYGKNPSDNSGDLQTLSNIATDNAFKIYEFWYQHRFANDAIKLLFGLHDYNSTFYSLASAGLFTMASFGIGPDTSQVTPSIFSTTSTALHLTLQGEHFYGLFAVYDGVPGDPDNPRGTHIQFNKGDGLFKAAEVGVAEEKKYKFAVGAWQKTTQEERAVDGELSTKNSGFYLIGEKNISDNVAAFFQYGRADDTKNQLDEYWGAGLTYANLIVNEDAVGLGAARAHNGLPFLRENPELEASETVWELTYFSPLVEHLNAQTSLYYVKNPSMMPSVDNAVALGLRLYIEF